MATYNDTIMLARGDADVDAHILADDEAIRLVLKQDRTTFILSVGVGEIDKGQYAAWDIAWHNEKDLSNLIEQLGMFSESLKALREKVQANEEEE